MADKPKKPVVFLCHSAKDKDSLTALKDLLSRRASGFIDFFLASDGQSLPLGENWQAHLTDALENAKLMLVFVSENSLDSKWVQFESGYGYAKKIKVVPVGLPGTEVTSMGSPLTSLMGFNLHSAAALSSLARLCNEACAGGMDENFSAEDFEKVFSTADTAADTAFGRWLPVVDEIELETNTYVVSLAISRWDPVGELSKILEQRALGESSAVKPVLMHHGDINRTLETEGMFAQQDKHGESDSIDAYDPISGKVEKAQKAYQMHFALKLAPELFHVYASLIDKWHAIAQPGYPISVKVLFTRGIKGLHDRHKITSKLHLTPIKVGQGVLRLDYKQFSFRLENTGQQRFLWFEYAGDLARLPLREIIAILFQRGVLTWVR